MYVVIAQYADLSGITRVATVEEEEEANQIIEDWKSFNAGWVFSVWGIAPYRYNASVYTAIAEGL